MDTVANKKHREASFPMFRIIFHLNVGLGMILLLFLNFFSADAQTASISSLQQQVELTIKKVKGASVFITDYDPQGKLPYGARFSGVVVSNDGIILTVAHAATPNQNYQVTFPDGRVCIAKGLGKAASIGAAMLQITDKGKWPFAELGTSACLKTNEPCISIAYPASFDNRMAVVRFGYVAEVSSATQENRFRTTCLMEPGDSGGPVFDLSGRVIGMNNNIDKSLDANFEVPVDLYKKYWNSLLQPEEYERSPIGEAFEVDTARTVPPVFSDVTLFGKSMIEAENTIARPVARIESILNKSKIYALGTLFNFGGVSYVLGKSSIVGDLIVVKPTKDQSINGQVAFRDEKRDLVLLKLDQPITTGISYESSKKTSGEMPLGQFLYSPLPDGEGSWSVIGSQKFSLEAKFRAGYSGAGTVIKNGKLILELIVANSGASEAELKVGDEIIAVDGKRVSTPESYITQVRKKLPGEVSIFTRIRDGKTEKIAVKLAKYPVITPNHPASYFEGGRSGISDGFNNVYVHDSRLVPSECGGPVFDLNGKLVGINIARYSRTSNIILSTSEITDFIKAAIAKNVFGT
jgi:serine protease Do